MGASRPALRRAAEVVPTLVMTGVALLLLIRPWNQPLRRPFQYSGDSISLATQVKNLIARGWYDDNPYLGYPFGQHLGDFPLGPDNLHWLMMRTMGFFTSDPILIINLYFLLSFFLIATAAFFCLRALGISVWAATAGATLFSFLPYHFLRGNNHLMLGAYWSVPIGCGMLLALLRQPLPLLRPGPGFPRPEWSRRSVAFVAGGLLLGSGGFYYAAFFLVLAAVVSAVQAMTVRDLRPLVAAGAMGAIVVFALVVNTAPQLMYQRDHGENKEVAQRTVEDSEYYALRPIQMIVPTPGHRIKALEQITLDSLKSPYNSENSAYLGTIATLGFLALLGVALTAIAGGRGTGSLFRQLALPIIPAIVIGVGGGLSWVIGLAGITEIRAWNRISVYIAFFSFAAVAAGLDRAAATRRIAPRARWALPVAAVALVIVGVLDQTSPTFVPDSRRTQAEFNNDRAFVTRIEARLRPGDAVFQLPYLPFPEAEGHRRFGLTDYDPFRGYLHSRKLRWSYGGMRGRESDWQVSAVRKPPREFLEAITAVGFRGLWIDRKGYPDQGHLLESAVGEITGTELTASGDGRFSFFSLGGFARQQASQRTDAQIEALRRRTLAALPVENLEGFWDKVPELRAGSLFSAVDATLGVRNRTERPQPVRVRARLLPPEGLSGTLTLTTGDQRAQVPFGPKPSTFDAPLVLAPGNQEIHFSFAVTGGPASTLPWELEDLEVIPTGRPGSRSAG